MASLPVVDVLESWAKFNGLGTPSVSDIDRAFDGEGFSGVLTVDGGIVTIQLDAHGTATANMSDADVLWYSGSEKKRMARFGAGAAFIDFVEDGSTVFREK